MVDAIKLFRDEYDFLSNFYYISVPYKGLNFPTSEHAFQWEKVTDNASKLLVSTARTPDLAKLLGRGGVKRDDWDFVKIDVMLTILRLKFASSYLGAKLIETGDKILIEGNTWGDQFWGVCGGTGSNYLGKLLMQVRSELQKVG